MFIWVPGISSNFSVLIELIRKLICYCSKQSLSTVILLGGLVWRSIECNLASKRSGMSWLILAPRISNQPSNFPGISKRGRWFIRFHHSGLNGKAHPFAAKWGKLMKLRLAQAGRVLLNLSELHARRAENATDSGPFTEAQRTHRAQTNSKWSYSLISLHVNHLKVQWHLLIGSMIFVTDVLKIQWLLLHIVNS